MLFYVFFVFSHCICLKCSTGNLALYIFVLTLDKTKLCPEYIHVYNIVTVLASSNYFCAIVDNIA